MFNWKMYNVLFAICALAIVLACGGSSDDDTATTAATSTATETQTLEVSTQIVAPTADAAAIAREAIGEAVEGYTEDVVTGATVTLTLADGTVFTLQDNGNGYYSNTVTLPKGSGFVIEARKGDLLLVNMFNDPTVTGTQFDAGQTNAATTAFAEIVRNTILETLGDSNVETADFADLVNKMGDATITVDWTQLKKDVTEDGNATYTNIVTTYTALLSKADTAAASGDDLLTKFRAGDSSLNIQTSWTQIKTTLQNVTLPVINDDIEAIRAGFALAKAAYDSGDLTTFASFLAESYLDSGYDKSHELVRLQQEWATETNRQSVLDIVDIVLDSAKTSATARMVGMSTWTENGVTHSEKSEELMNFVKENGSWKYSGNQKKSWAHFWLTLSKYESADAQISTNYCIGMEVEEAPASYPISSVTVAGPAGATYTLVKAVEGEDESWISQGMNWEETLARTPVVGDKYTMTITYQDSTTETINYTIMVVPPTSAAFPVVTAPSAGAVISGDTFTFTWTNVSGKHNLPEYYNVYVWMMNTALVERDNIPLNVSTLSFPTTGMQTGTYQINCDLNTRHYKMRWSKEIAISKQ